MQHMADEQKALYAISKDHDTESSLFEEIVELLKNKNVLSKKPGRIYIEDNTIYFHCNLNEISILLKEFVNRMVIKGNRRFDEIWIFEKNNLIPNSGIKIHRFDKSTFEKQKEKIVEIREKLKSFDWDSASDIDRSLEDKPDIMQELLISLQKYKGICIGELHPFVEPKEFIIGFLSRKPPITDFYIEMSFFDTQKELYEELHKTSVTPNPLLRYLTGIDEKTRLIKNKDGLIASYQKNPFSYLGIIIMAQMQGIKVTPIDHTIASDGNLEYAYTVGVSKKFAKKRLLLMNYNCYEIVSTAREGSYIIFDGSEHNITNKQFKVPSINALLNIPNYNVPRSPKWSLSFQNSLLDPYTHALLQHNISRALLGEPIKIYQPLPFMPKDIITCQKLIFLQEIKDEIAHTKWDSKAEAKFLSLKWTPATISLLRSKLKALDNISKDEDVNQIFAIILNDLEKSLLKQPKGMGTRTSDVKEYYLNKYLQGMDLVDPTFRHQNYPQTYPFGFEPPSKSKNPKNKPKHHLEC